MGQYSARELAASDSQLVMTSIFDEYLRVHSNHTICPTTVLTTFSQVRQREMDPREGNVVWVGVRFEADFLGDISVDRWFKLNQISVIHQFPIDPDLITQQELHRTVTRVHFKRHMDTGYHNVTLRRWAPQRMNSHTYLLDHTGLDRDLLALQYALLRELLCFRGESRAEINVRRDFHISFH